jgi:hypothetical protein
VCKVGVRYLDGQKKLEQLRSEVRLIQAIAERDRLLTAGFLDNRLFEINSLPHSFLFATLLKRFF